MKFKHRLFIGVLLAFALVSAYYILESVSNIPSSQGRLRKVRLAESQLWPLQVQRKNPIIEDENAECDFMSHEANTKYHTAKLLTASQQLEWNGSNYDYGPGSNDNIKVILMPFTNINPATLEAESGHSDQYIKEILDNMLLFLTENSDLRFIWSETYYIIRWFENLSTLDKDKVRALIRTGALEITIGGLVMPDEACTTTYALLDQLLEGNIYINRHLGAVSRSAWSSDSLGHSPTISYLYTRSGINNLALVNVNWRLKEFLQKSRAMEFNWRQQWEETYEILKSRYERDMHTIVLPGPSYNIPDQCGPKRQVCSTFNFLSNNKNTRLDKNFHESVKQLIEQLRSKSSLYSNDVVLYPYGDNNRLHDRREWKEMYKGFKSVMDYVNNATEFGITMQFGTLNDYFNAVNQVYDRSKLPLLSGDFFTYSDKGPDFWSGFYSSYSFHKLIGRRLERELRSAEILSSLARAYSTPYQESFSPKLDIKRILRTARRQLGLFQHSSAIKGLNNSRVMDNYLKQLNDALQSSYKVQSAAAKFLFKIIDGEAQNVHRINTNSESNINTGNVVATKGGLDLLLFNSIAQHREQLVHLFVDHSDVKVVDEEGLTVDAQLNPVWKVLKSSIEIEKNRFELIFLANLPPMGMRKYIIKERSKDLRMKTQIAFLMNGKPKTMKRQNIFSVVKETNDRITLNGFGFVCDFNKVNGQVQQVFYPQGNYTQNLSLDLIVNTIGSGSDVYVNRVKHKYSLQGFYGKGKTGVNPMVLVVDGELSSEVNVIWPDWQHRVRLCSVPSVVCRALEIKNLVNQGKDSIMKDVEYAIRLRTSVATNGKFYTDLNGFQMAQRERLNSLPDAANVYPVTESAYFQDSKARVTLLVNQPVGVSSPFDGSIEIAFDRCGKSSDGKNQGTVQKVSTSSEFMLLVEFPSVSGYKFSDQVSHSSLLSLNVNNMFQYPPTVFSMSNKVTSSERLFEPLTDPFPCDMQLLNLRHAFDQNFALAVFHRAFDCRFPSESLQCSTSSSHIPIVRLLSHIKLKKIAETSLTMGQTYKRFSVGTSLYIRPMEIGMYNVTFA